LADPVLPDAHCVRATPGAIDGGFGEG